MSDIGSACNVNYIKWMWKSNEDPFNPTQKEEWKLYPLSIVAIIECAHSARTPYVRVDEHYIIDLYKMMHINIHDTTRQRPIIRCDNRKVENEATDQVQVCLVRKDSPIEDTNNETTSQEHVFCDGWEFIMNWLLKFNKGKLKVKFDKIFPALIAGIQLEGQLAQEDPKKIEDIIHELQEASNNVKNKKESVRIEHLSKCCVRQYTKQCFLFRVVNETLRDDNRAKLDTIGPFAYLVFNYVSHRTHDDKSFRYRLRQIFQPSHTSILYLYRGDYVTKEIFDQYQQAVGQSEKYFQWVSFVSTSRDRIVGERFTKNILYVIELSGAMSNDQFSDLQEISLFVKEKDILLRPGARFRVKEVTLGSPCAPHIVTIKIAPSFVSVVQ